MPREGRLRCSCVGEYNRPKAVCSKGSTWTKPTHREDYSRASCSSSAGFGPGLKQQGQARQWSSLGQCPSMLPAPRWDLGGWAGRRAYSSQLCICTVRGLSDTISRPLPALWGRRTLVLDQLKNSPVYNQMEMKIAALLMAVLEHLN